MNTDTNIHRFHDKVAIQVGTGETIYYSVKAARQISAAINKVSRSIERTAYGESRIGSLNIEGPEV